MSTTTAENTEVTSGAGTTINNSITIGTSAYPSPFTLAASSLVLPSSDGAAGAQILAGGSLTNAGQIDGGTGGQGVILSAAALLSNTGLILGGQGGAAVYDNGSTVTTDGTSTTLAPLIATISTSLATAVTLGVNGYAERLTLTNTAVIANLPSRQINGASALTTQADASAYVLNRGTLIGGYAVGGGYGAVLRGAAVLSNQGLIAGGNGIVEAGSGVFLYTSANAALLNSGTIIGGYNKSAGAGVGVVAGTGDFIANTGHITGGGAGPSAIGNDTGISLFGATLINAGTIAGGGSGHPTLLGVDEAGVFLNAGFINNTGVITGATSTYGGFGIYTAGGTIINAGTLSGGLLANGYHALAVAFKYEARYSTAPRTTLIVDPGAVFQGGVAVFHGNYPVAYPGNSATLNADNSPTLLLASAASAGTLNMGGSFSGISSLDFASGANWTLEGNASELAGGETINGFATGDTLILDGFSGSSYVFAPGSGLTLSGPKAKETLDLSALPADDRLAITANNLGTTIAPYIATLTNTVTIGTAAYPSPFTLSILGVIGPASYGIGVVALPDTYLDNQGSITGGRAGPPANVYANGGVGGLGIYLESGATLSNSGTLSGGAGGNAVKGRTGSGGAGAELELQAVLTNDGLISGGLGGYHLSNLANSSSPGAGIIINGGTVFNAGTIQGAAGVEIDGGILFNRGTVSGGDAVLFLGAGTLEVAPGAVFIGSVAADPNADDTLILASAAAAGTLDMGNGFTGFTEIAFAPGADWTLAGNAEQLAAIPTITGFSAGDTLIVEGLSATSETYVSGTGLEFLSGSSALTLHLEGELNNGTLAGAILATPDVACFAAGTRIATTRGNIPVEHLKIGDRVKTMHQGDAPVKWIGLRSYDGRFIAGNPDALPVRLRRHAIAPNVPSRDLYVSPDHAICEAGVLIHARLLVNGASITQLEHVEQITYYHLELETHDVIYANNTPAESFIDEHARHRFQNADTAPPSAAQSPCLPRLFDGFHLARIKSRLNARAGVKHPVAQRSPHIVIDESTPTLLRGWAQFPDAPEHPVTLKIISGRHAYNIIANAYRPDLQKAGLGTGCHAFTLSAHFPEPPSITPLTSIPSSRQRKLASLPATSGPCHTLRKHQIL